MGSITQRHLFFAATLCVLAAPTVRAQSSDDPDYVDPVAEAAAAALQASNLEADAFLGRQGLPVTSPAAALVLPAGGKALAATAPDWIYAPTAKPMLQVPIKAIFLRDDDGSRPCAITASNVNTWRVRANSVWAGSGIEFTFDPSAGSTDYFWMNSTLLNSVGGTSVPEWPAQLNLATNLANLFPGQLVMYFRYGPDATPTGGGFSWTSMQFIMMPGFYSTGVCGVQNIGLMAHEIGHYLGLPHTFPAEFVSYTAALNFYLAGGTGPMNDVFEADGRDHTEPDPYINAWGYQCDTSTTAITLSGKTFVLPRDNVMTYYHPITEVVTSQYNTSRQVWALRAGKPVHELILGGLATYEAEDLGGTISGGWWTSQAMGSFLGKWSNDHQQVWLDAAIGDTMRLDFPVATAGSYDVYVGLTAAPDYATVDPKVNGVHCNSEQLYASIVLPTGPVFLGTHTLLKGTNKLELTVTGNDPRIPVPRQGVGVDYIALASPSAASQEVVRVGFPANPSVLKPGIFGGPYVGNVWSPRVDHTSFVTDALVDVLAVSGGTANWYLGVQGTILVNLNTVIGYYTRWPGSYFWFQIPLEPAYVGLVLHTQAGSYGAADYFKLTNALDVTIGSY